LHKSRSPAKSNQKQRRGAIIVQRRPSRSFSVDGCGRTDAQDEQARSLTLSFISIDDYLCQQDSCVLILSSAIAQLPDCQPKQPGLLKQLLTELGMLSTGWLGRLESV
jgi:hypothetical protein